MHVILSSKAMKNKILVSQVKDFIRRIKIYASNMSWIMMERVANLGITFAITILVARYLGPTQFGVLSYATSLIALFAVAGHMGLSGLVVRDLVSHPEYVPQTMGTSFVLKMVGYLFSLLLVFIFALTTKDSQDGEFLILLILASALIFQPINVLDFWFQSRLEAKFTAIAKTIALISVSIIKIGCIFLGAHLIAFAVANTVQVILTSLVLILYYYRRSPHSFKSWRFSSARAKKLFSQSWIIFLGSIFAVIYLKVDQIMLKWLVSSEEVGIYAVSASLSEAWYFVPSAIVISVFPRLIKLRESDSIQYSKRLQNLFDLLFVSALAVAVIITLTSQPLINIFFGHEYSGAAPILTVHIWAALFIFMRAAFSKWVLIENFLIFSLITHGFGALVNVGLNFFLIPLFGGLGAAYATLISYAVSSYISLSLHPKTRPIFLMMTKSMLFPYRYAIYLYRLKL
jgi:O-antigen/teichoic acid export membrane protein